MSYISHGDNQNPISTSNPLPVIPTGSALPFRRIATADTNLATVKATAGKLFSIVLINASASAKYLKIYDKPSNPVLASDTPVMTIPVAATGSTVLPLAGDIGVSFSNGIAIAITGGIGDTDTTALVANDVVLNMVYR